jgi:hypothetical protein
MANVASPYGFTPISDQVGVSPRRVRIPNGIVSGQAGNIFMGTPVTINPATGTLLPVTANTQRIFGIFSGVEYTPVGGRPTESPFWAAGTVWDPTYDFFAWIFPAWMPSTRFQVQADGSVTQGELGSGFNITNFAAGNTFTGVSGCTVGAAGVAAGLQAQFTLTEFYDNTGVTGTIGDAFTDLIVTVAYPQVGFGGQTSIG